MANPFESMITQARQRLDAGDASAALQLARQILASANGPVPGVHLLRAQAFIKLASFLQALQAAEAEVFVNPTDPAARQTLDGLLAKVARGPRQPAERKWASAIDQKQFDGYEYAAHRYTYRGIPMVKNSFDFALYPRLLHQIRPATIIEVGTFYGGSAVWMADLTRAFGCQRTSIRSTWSRST